MLQFVKIKEHKNMKSLIVVADDFGWSKAINAGIMKSYLEGLVTEISYSPGFPGQEDALSLLHSQKIYDVGLHMVLIPPNQNEGRQLRRDDYQELFKKKSDLEIRELVEQEVENFVKQVGKPPTHITAQYGIHGNLKVLDGLISVSKKYSVPFRIPRVALGKKPFSVNYAAEIMLNRSSIKHTEHIVEEIAGLDYEKVKENIFSDLAKVKGDESVELLFHPGYLDEEVVAMTSLRAERCRDLALCLDEDLRKQIDALGFSLRSYTEFNHE